MASPGLDFGTCVRELWVVLAPAQNFNRRISAKEVAILTAAGFGSKTTGFRNLLDLYQELQGGKHHNCWKECDTPPPPGWKWPPVFSAAGAGGSTQSAMRSVV